MKKAVITILLVLPFVLIYFISFTGRILSKYTHIYVERVTVVNELGSEMEEDSFITMNKGEDYVLGITIYPELASNKKVIISNSNKNVCSIADDYTVTALDYGTSRIMITSEDRHFAQFTINIRVVETNVLDIDVNKDEVFITRGKTEQINATVLPLTIIDDNRGLIWSSADESIATVSDNGLISGVSLGDTIVTVQSEVNPEIYKDILVHIISTYSTGIFFDYSDSGKTYDIYTDTFDLKPITIINNMPEITIDDLYYTVETISNVDDSMLGDGIIKFNAPNTIVIIAVNYDGEIKDTITIRYINE